MIESDWTGEITLDLICSARKTSQNQDLNGKKEPVMCGTGERVAWVENKSKGPEAEMSLLCLGTQEVCREVLPPNTPGQEYATSRVPVQK